MMEKLALKRFIPHGRAFASSLRSCLRSTDPSKPKLLDQVRLAIRTHPYSRRTEEACVGGSIRSRNRGSL
jgi:hypothetical protein